MSGIRTNSGNRVQREWEIPARQTRFHKKGDFFMPLTIWPGALADPSGYILFQTKEQLEACAGVHYRGKGTANVRLGVHGGISNIRNYVRKRQGNLDSAREVL